jgi:hypothetical protein
MPWTVAQHAPLLEHALPVRFSVYSALSVALISARWLAIRRLAWPRWGLVLVGLACLVPRITPEWHPGVHVPRFFAGGTYRRYVERGETIVLLPVTQSMLWQAQTRMYFSMATGRLGVEPSGFEGWHVAKRFRYVSIGPRMIGDVRVFLAAHHVGAIVVSDSQAATWRRALAPLGVRPVHVDGVDVYDVSGAAGATASAGAAAA